jgi:transposase
MEITRVGLDIAKRVFQVHGVDELGRMQVSKKLSRAECWDSLRNCRPV